MTQAKCRTTKEIPYPYYGQKSYRIETKITKHAEHFQRHIWTDINGKIETEEWIKSWAFKGAQS